MIDARCEIKSLLESIESNTSFRVREMFPKSFEDGVLVTFFELNNINTQVSFVDDLSFQIDVWTYDLETLVELSVLIDEKMTVRGWKRTFSSPDSMMNDPSGYLRKTFHYGRKVDLRTNRLID